MSDWSPKRYPRGRGCVTLIEDAVISELVINNPAARNAMSLGMMADIVEAVATLQSRPPLALLIRGEGGEAFCAGGDLREVRAHLMDSKAAEGMPVVMGDSLDAIADLPTVVVVAIEGAALGGGAELTTVADWVVAAESATIGFVHGALGVSPGWGGARRLIERVGVASATEILLPAGRLTVDRAMALGLVHASAPDGEAVAEARAWLARVTRWPQASVRGLLSILRAARSGEDVRHRERDVFARLWAGPAHQAALEQIKAGE